MSETTTRRQGRRSRTTGATIDLTTDPPTGPSGPATGPDGAPDAPGARRAGVPQAAVLLLASTLPILGAVLLAPVLPLLEDTFAGTPGVAALVPVTLTIPALMIGLLAPFAGRIADLLGRKRLLVGALVTYSVFGLAPLLLDSLPLIVLTRVGVGVAEAAIMTCCTTLLADYWSGRQRDRVIGLQVVATTLSATLFFALGGALGEVSWRAPFWLYAAGVVLALPAALLLWQPARPAAERHDSLPPLPWRTLAFPCAVTLFGGISFYALIVELSYVLDDLGVQSVGTIGAVSAVASLATAAGGVTFGRIARRGPAVLLPIAFGLIGIGLAVVGAAPAVPVVVVGGVIAGFGSGLLLPTLLTWALSGLSFDQRGRGTGRFTAALFLGEFFSPLLILAIAGVIGGIGGGLVVLGVLAVIVALGLRLVRVGQPAQTTETADAAA